MEPRSPASSTTRGPADVAAPAVRDPSSPRLRPQPTRIAETSTTRRTVIRIEGFDIECRFEFLRSRDRRHESGVPRERAGKVDLSDVSDDELVAAEALSPTGATGSLDSPGREQHCAPLERGAPKQGVDPDVYLVARGSSGSSIRISSAPQRAAVR